MKGGKDVPMPPTLREQVEQRPPEARRKIERVWRLLGHLETDRLDVPETDEAWADLQQRLDAAAPAAKAGRRAPDRARRRHSARRRWGVTVGLGVAVLMLGLWVWPQSVEVVVPRGAQRVVSLPDGSTVHLNSDSRLRYRQGFQAWPFVAASVRAVQLDGEAFFEVEHGTRPFVVETFNARVEVLGTAFNVRARQGPWEEETRVTLASGRVQVTAPQDPDYAMMLSEAGQVARVGAATAAPEGTAEAEDGAQRLLVWRQQGFSVVNQPLAFILAEIERRFALEIAVEPGMALTDSMSLFYPRGTSAEQIIHDICLAQHCRYRETSGGFAMFPANP